MTVIANTVAYPIDTVRRRLQMQSGRKDVLYKGAVDCFKVIAREEGSRAFFKGGASNAIRATGGAIVLVLYEKIQQYLGF